MEVVRIENAVQMKGILKNHLLHPRKINLLRKR